MTVAGYTSRLLLLISLSHLTGKARAARLQYPFNFLT